MRLVDEKQKVTREVIEQTEGNRPLRPTRKHSGIVFYSGAEAYLAYHFHIVFCALFYALCFEEFSLLPEFRNALRHFPVYFVKCGVALCLRGCIMRCGIYRRIRKAALCFTRQNVYLAYSFDFVSEKFNAESGRVRRGHHFDGISPCAELVPCEGEVVAIVVYRYQPTHKLLAGDCHSLAHGQNERLVFRGVAEGIYA